MNFLQIWISKSIGHEKFEYCFIWAGKDWYKIQLFDLAEVWLLIQLSTGTGCYYRRSECSLTIDPIEK